MNRFTTLATFLIVAGSLTLSAGTKLSKAVIAGDLDYVKQFDFKHDPINEIDHWGWTPLMWSVYYRYLPMTEYLLANGADPNAQATNAYMSLARNATPLIIAAYYGLEDQTEVLLAKGGKVDQADATGMTPKAYAKKFGFTGVLEMMTKVGAAPAAAAAGAAPQAAAAETVDLGKGVDGSRLARTYTKVLVEEFTTTKEIAKDYLASVKECQGGALSVLIDRKAFDNVDLRPSGKTADASTLVVRVEVTELRITSGAARFWVGAMAGSSYVKAKVTLMDGAGKVEREANLTTENNAWGAAWTGGSTDRTIPKDMGAIIAGYVITVAGRK